MDASCKLQDNIHKFKLNIYVSRILGTHHFEKNPSTGTWSSHAVINNEIHITYRVNDLSGKLKLE